MVIVNYQSSEKTSGVIVISIDPAIMCPTHGRSASRALRSTETVEMDLDKGETEEKRRFKSLLDFSSQFAREWPTAAEAPLMCYDGN